MIISFIQALVVALGTLGLAAGCTSSSPDTPAAVATVDAKTAVNRDLAGDLLGALKLVRQEYANAVTAGGTTVVDATEYSETELFAEQAERKAAAWRAAGGLSDPGQAERLSKHLAAIRAAVAHKAPHAEVLD